MLRKFFESNKRIFFMLLVVVVLYCAFLVGEAISFWAGFLVPVIAIAIYILMRYILFNTYRIIKSKTLADHIIKNLYKMGFNVDLDNSQYFEIFLGGNLRYRAQFGNALSSPDVAKSIVMAIHDRKLLVDPNPIDYFLCVKDIFASNKYYEVGVDANGSVVLLVYPHRYPVTINVDKWLANGGREIVENEFRYCLEVDGNLDMVNLHHIFDRCRYGF